MFMSLIELESKIRYLKEEKMEEELERIRDTWLREDSDKENQGGVRRNLQERERASGLLRQQIYQQDKAVGKLVGYN